MSAMRCPAIAPQGHEGHAGPHTALIATEFVEWRGNIGTPKRRTSLGTVQSDDKVVRTLSDRREDSADQRPGDGR